MSNSLLNGTIWYWRQGLKEAPMHGDMCRTNELYMPVRNEEQAKKIINELGNNGIGADMKKTHSTYDVVPAGSLIVFAAESQEVPSESEKANMEKLESYISANGGKINENPKTFSAIRLFIQKIFER